MRIKLLVLTFLFLFFGVSPVFATTIKINEFYAAGSTSSNPDWVEIYNDGTDISLYQLIDGANNKKDLSLANCKGNFCTVDWYNTLNNGGDTIKLILKSSPDTSVDQIIYGTGGDISVPGITQSAGRNPDGTGGWTIFSSFSKGTSNNIAIPTPTPQPTLIAVSSPTSFATLQSSSSFTISDIPSRINSDQSFTTLVNLSLSDKPNTNFYLKGAFKKSDSSNYFGLTKVSGNWVKNGSSYSNQLPITTDSSGNWSGNLEAMVDSEDSGYLGSGDYIFKVAKYDPLIWSNEVTIHINNIEIAQESSSVNQTSFETTATPSPTTPALSKSSVSQSKSFTRVASVAGVSKSASPSTSSASSTSANIKVADKKQINPFVFIGIIFIIAGVGSLGYIFLYRNETVYKYFRRRN